MAIHYLLKTNRGVVLFMVLSTILIVVALANIILVLITSQFRLTHHQVSRIQAYYAAQAGMNYALEMLRDGTWNSASCPSPTSCLLSVLDPDFRDTFPHTISDVSIIIKPAQDTNENQPCYKPPGNSACVSATANYTYANP